MSPVVSVVVPTCRRPDLLARCLQALAGQDLPPESYEILVADDASLARTRAQVEAFSAWARPALRYLPVTGAHGPAAARNVGWRAARGGVVAFTDDDTLPDASWLREALAAFEKDHELAAAAGRVVVPLPPSPRDYERNEAGLEAAEFVTANCFVRREVLEKLCGFDERFTAAWREDSDLHFRLLGAGRKVGKVPSAVVVHPVRPAPWGVSLRQQRKSLFDALLYKKHPALYRGRIRRLPPLDYYGIVASLLVGVAGAIAGSLAVATAALVVWLVLTARFMARRLRATSRAPGHVAEMVFTSVLIPPLSVFWRLHGALRFRVVFF
jgi:GT2 family glycosyltransferase